MAKKGELVGGSITQEVVDSSRSILHPNRAGKTKGLQQVFTERVVASFIGSVVGASSLTWRTYQEHAVLDLTAGNGALLEPYPEELRYGIEIDQDQVLAANFQGRPYGALEGDVQRIFPLLRGLGVLFPVVVTNPPFSLDWDVPGLAKGSSTYVAMRMAKALLTDNGLGVLVCGKHRFDVECRAELEKQLFALVEVETLFPGVDTPCVIAFWRQGFPTMPGIAPYTLKLKHFSELEGQGGRKAGTYSEAIHKTHIQRFGSWHSEVKGPTEDTLKALREELAVRRAAREREADASHYLIRMKGRKMRVKLTPYSTLALNKLGHNVLQWVYSFDRQPANYFALQSRQWRRLQDVAEEAGLEVDPAVTAQVEESLVKFRHQATPMYRLPDVQRLGFLDEQDEVECISSDDKRGYIEGKRYEVVCETKVLAKTEHREVIGKDDQPGVQEVLVTRKAMAIRIGKHTFTESTDDMKYLLEHFRVPDPGDLETVEPEKVRYWLGILDRVEQEIRVHLPEFRFWWYQKEDLARGLVKGRFILAWEQGLGKALGIAAFVRALELGGRLPDSCALFPMPQDLARQFAAEVKRFFGRDVLMVGTLGRYIRKQQSGGFAGAIRRWDAGTWEPDAEMAGEPREGEVTSFEVAELVKARRAWLRKQRRAQQDGQPFAVPEVPGVWAVTWYEVLAVSGRIDELMPVRNIGLQLAKVDTQRKVPEGAPVPVLDADTMKRMERELGQKEYRKRVQQTFMRVPSNEACPSCRADSDAGWNGRTCKAVLNMHEPLVDRDGRVIRDTPMLAERRRASGWAKNHQMYSGRSGAMVGERKGRERCGHVDVARHRKPAYRVLRNLFRVVCVDEGTKIKGDDSLTSKAVRALKARYRVVASGTPQKNFVTDLFWLLYWALGDSSPRFPYAYVGGRTRWEEDFAVVETVIEREGDKARKGRTKVLPEVSNLLRLWKLLCSGVLRRRMDDVGCVVDEQGGWTCRGCGAKATVNVKGPDGGYRKPDGLDCAACGRHFGAIVPIIFKPVVAPWGKAQKAFHLAWLDENKFLEHFRRKHPNSPVWKLGEGMVKRMAACLGQLAKLDYATTDPCGEPDGDYNPPGLSPWTPQRLHLLRDVEAAVRGGGKCLVGSCLVGVGPWMAAQLKARGIRAVHITEEGKDGRASTLSPGARAGIIKDFRDGKYDVLCVGVNAVALGHNLDMATHVFGDGLPWDFATWDQFLKRARRLSSRKPVTVYVYFPENSLGAKKWSVIGDKTDASDLVLDGRIAERREAGIDKVSVLREMQEAGARVDGTEIEEAEIHALWTRGGAAPAEQKVGPPRRRQLVAVPELVTARPPMRRRVAPQDAQGMLLPQYTPRFRTILADFPWPEYGGGGRGAQNHYNLLKPADMPKVVRDSGLFLPYANAHFYCWTTNNYLPDALTVIDRLGFRYVTNVVWVKPRSGIGQYFRGQHELLLFAVRGEGMNEEVMSERMDLPTVIHADHVRDAEGAIIHSAKPAAFYDLIENRSHGPYLELFARGTGRPGWTVWGEEARGARAAG